MHNLSTCHLEIDLLQIKTRNKQQKLLDRTWEKYISKTSNYETLKVTAFIFAEWTSKRQRFAKNSSKLSASCMFASCLAGGQIGEGKAHGVNEAQIQT